MKNEVEKFRRIFFDMNAEMKSQPKENKQNSISKEYLDGLQVKLNDHLTKELTNEYPIILMKNSNLDSLLLLATEKGNLFIFKTVLSKIKEQTEYKLFNPGNSLVHRDFELLIYASIYNPPIYSFLLKCFESSTFFSSDKKIDLNFADTILKNILAIKGNLDKKGVIEMLSKIDSECYSYNKFIDEAVKTTKKYLNNNVSPELDEYNDYIAEICAPKEQQGTSMTDSTSDSFFLVSNKKDREISPEECTFTAVEHPEENITPCNFLQKLNNGSEAKSPTKQLLDLIYAYVPAESKDLVAAQEQLTVQINQDGENRLHRAVREFSNSDEPISTALTGVLSKVVSRKIYSSALSQLAFYTVLGKRTTVTPIDMIVAKILNFYGDMKLYDNRTIPLSYFQSYLNMIKDLTDHKDYLSGYQQTRERLVCHTFAKFTILFAEDKEDTNMNIIMNLLDKVPNDFFSIDKAAFKAYLYKILEIHFPKTSIAQERLGYYAKQLGVNKPNSNGALEERKQNTTTINNNSLREEEGTLKTETYKELTENNPTIAQQLESELQVKTGDRAEDKPGIASIKPNAETSETAKALSDTQPPVVRALTELNPVTESSTDSSKPVKIQTEDNTLQMSQDTTADEKRNQETKIENNEKSTEIKSNIAQQLESNSGVDANNSARTQPEISPTPEDSQPNSAVNPDAPEAATTASPETQSKAPPLSAKGKADTEPKTVEESSTDSSKPALTQPAPSDLVETQAKSTLESSLEFRNSLVNMVSLLKETFSDVEFQLKPKKELNKETQQDLENLTKNFAQAIFTHYQNKDKAENSKNIHDLVFKLLGNKLNEKIQNIINYRSTIDYGFNFFFEKLEEISNRAESAKTPVPAGTIPATTPSPSPATGPDLASNTTRDLAAAAAPAPNPATPAPSKPDASASNPATLASRKPPAPAPNSHTNPSNRGALPNSNSSENSAITPYTGFKPTAPVKKEGFIKSNPLLILSVVIVTLGIAAFFFRKELSSFVDKLPGFVGKLPGLATEKLSDLVTEIPKTCGNIFKIKNIPTRIPHSR